MLKEFKKFILRGNMVDLAVGVIIGSAFGKVVEKFAECLMTAIGVLFSPVGGTDKLKELDVISPYGIKIGPVITQTLNLILVGFALFIFIKLYNRLLAKPKVDEPAPPNATEKLLMEIRDELRKRDGGTRVE